MPKTTTVRFNQEDLEILDYLVQKNGYTVTDALRYSLRTALELDKAIDELTAQIAKQKVGAL